MVAAWSAAQRQRMRNDTVLYTVHFTGYVQTLVYIHVQLVLYETQNPFFTMVSGLTNSMSSAACKSH